MPTNFALLVSVSTLGDTATLDVHLNLTLSHSQYGAYTLARAKTKHTTKSAPNTDAYIGQLGEAILELLPEVSVTAAGIAVGKNVGASRKLMAITSLGLLTGNGASAVAIIAVLEVARDASILCFISSVPRDATIAAK